MADNDSQEVGFVEKNSRTRFIVTATEWKNEKYCDVREYYLDDGEEWKPTKKGIRINSSLLDDFQKVLKDFKELPE